METQNDIQYTYIYNLFVFETSLHLIYSVKIRKINRFFSPTRTIIVTPCWVRMSHILKWKTYFIYKESFNLWLIYSNAACETFPRDRRNESKCSERDRVIASRSEMVDPGIWGKKSAVSAYWKSSVNGADSQVQVCKYKHSWPNDLSRIKQFW